MGSDNDGVGFSGRCCSPKLAFRMGVVAVLCFGMGMVLSASLTGSGSSPAATATATAQANEAAAVDLEQEVSRRVEEEIRAREVAAKDKVEAEAAAMWTKVHERRKRRFSAEAPVEAAPSEEVAPPVEEDPVSPWEPTAGGAKPLGALQQFSITDLLGTRDDETKPLRVRDLSPSALETIVNHVKQFSGSPRVNYRWQNRAPQADVPTEEPPVVPEPSPMPAVPPPAVNPPMPFTKAKDAFMADVGVVAIVKGENDFLPDWIQYHSLLGVQRFWIYTNDCGNVDGLEAAVKPFTANGMVTLNKRFLCEKKFQRVAYNDALAHVSATREVKWLGFFDIDEFFVPEDPSRSIPEVLHNYEDDLIAAVAFWRLTFGPSDHVKPPNASVVAAYTRHQHPYKRKGSQVKMWVRTDRCRHIQIHGCDVTKPRFEVVGTGKVPFNYYVRGKIKYPPVFDFSAGWFNHYYTRSLHDFIAKNNRGDAQYAQRIANRVKLPPGGDDVFNVDAMATVRAHLDRLAAGDPVAAKALEATLLRGMPSTEQVGEWTRYYSDHGAMWGPAMRQEGEARMRRREYPIGGVLPDPIVPVSRPADDDGVRAEALKTLRKQYSDRVGTKKKKHGV